MEISTLVIFGLIAAIVVYIIAIYNRLVILKNRFKNAFSQIEVQLKRRYDLIPNLVETAKGYLQHERQTLEAVVEARNTALSSLKNAAADPGNVSAMQGLIGAESALAGALGKLNVVIEAYPDLKANTNMQQLHEEITSTENKVSFARQAYNDAVMNFNTYRQSFPPNMFTNTFGFKDDAVLLKFEDSEAIQKAPQVKFSD